MDSPQNSPHAPKEQGRNVLCVDLHQQLTWSRREAAAMCGVSVNMFSDWVREGFMPQPMRNKRFSADAVRKRLLVDGGATNLESAYDRWKAAS